MPNARPLLAVLLVLLLVGVSIAWTTGEPVGPMLSFLISWPALLIVVGGTLVYLAVLVPAGDLQRTLRTALLGPAGAGGEVAATGHHEADDEPDDEADEVGALAAIEILETGARASLLLGALGFFVGLVSLLAILASSVGEPSPARLASALSVALTSLLYSLVGSEVLFHGLVVQCRRRLRPGAAPASSASSAPALLVAVLAGLAVAVVLLVPVGPSQDAAAEAPQVETPSGG